MDTRPLVIVLGNGEKEFGDDSDTSLDDLVRKTINASTDDEDGKDDEQFSGRPPTEPDGGTAMDTAENDAPDH